MMGQQFLSVRTSDGEDRMVNVEHILMLAESDNPTRLMLWLTNRNAYEVVGTMSDVRFALATLGVSIMPLHDFTSDDAVKE